MQMLILLLRHLPAEPVRHSLKSWKLESAPNTGWRTLARPEVSEKTEKTLSLPRGWQGI
jgi:hypothetical protein